MASQLKKEDEIKIFILYLLDKIGYPLDYPSIGSIMMQDGIVNFFDFAQCFFALVDAGHIRELVIDKAELNGETPAQGGDGEDEEGEHEPNYTVLYEVTDKGRQVAGALSDSLMVTIREKSYRSALRHLSFERQGAYVDQSYRSNGDKTFTVSCSIKDQKGVVMDLTVRADSEYQLKRMLNNYSERPEVVFRGVLALLQGDVNYLFED
ncbi:MAG: DUF4364 family protein [Clostridia bacterium]|nr:DUF4364 family protein [Clostridia bacterium]